MPSANHQHHHSRSLSLPQMDLLQAQKKKKHNFPRQCNKNFSFINCLQVAEASSALLEEDGQQQQQQQQLQQQQQQRTSSSPFWFTQPSEGELARVATSGFQPLSADPLRQPRWGVKQFLAPNSFYIRMLNYSRTFPGPLSSACSTPPPSPGTSPGCSASWQETFATLTSGTR